MESDAIAELNEPRSTNTKIADIIVNGTLVETKLLIYGKVRCCFHIILNANRYYGILFPFSNIILKFLCTNTGHSCRWEQRCTMILWRFRFLRFLLLEERFVCLSCYTTTVPVNPTNSKATGRVWGGYNVPSLQTTKLASRVMDLKL